MRNSLKKFLSIEFIRKFLRFVTLPGILFVAWANWEWEAIRRELLLKKLDVTDPSTVALYGRIEIAHPEKCHIGHHVAIHDAEWNASGEITIGNYVHFGPRVTILSVSHNIDGNQLPYDDTYVYKPVVIEDCVWIGCDVVIAPGTHIEEGAVIAMGATVSGRISKGVIVGAPKWRVLKNRDMKRYQALKTEGKCL